MSDAIASMEAEGWTRDMTVAGAPSPERTPFAELRTRHLRRQGFETARIDCSEPGRPAEIVMKRRKRR